MRVLQVVSFLALYVWSPAAHANEEQYIAAYFKEHISMCELRNLSQYWKKEQYETKIMIGKELVAKRDLLPSIKKANSTARKNGVKDCEYWDLDFNYEDAEVMGRVWGVDTYEAKMKLALHTAENSFKETKNLVQTHRKTLSHQYPPQAQPIDIFGISTYDYCHAKMLSKAYGQESVYDGKLWIGQLLKDNQSTLLDSKLQFARSEAQKKKENRCDFADTPYTYKDAEILAKAWSISTEEAKTMIEQKYLYGAEGLIPSHLKK